MTKFFAFLVGQSCRSALNSWAAQQRRPTEDVKNSVLHPGLYAPKRAPAIAERNLGQKKDAFRRRKSFLRIILPSLRHASGSPLDTMLSALENPARVAAGAADYQSDIPAASASRGLTPVWNPVSSW